MNQISMVAADIQVAQKYEALLRMKKLGIHENAIREFKEEGKLNLSERGFLFWLNEEEEKFIRDWERKTENVVYHVIKNVYEEIGLCYSLLYVSKSVDEWEMDNEDLEEGCPIVYVLNRTIEDFSEYGSIGIKPMFGGVVRTC